MATLGIRFDERELLERSAVCIHCGRTAVACKHRTFYWRTGYTVLLNSWGLLPFLLRFLPSTQSKQLGLPLCDWHHNHWNKPLRLACFLLIIFFVWVFAATEMFAALIGVDDTARLIFSMVLLMGVSFQFTTEIQQRILQSIRVLEISENAITLTNISKEFVDHFRELRAHNAPAKFGDSRVKCVEDLLPGSIREGVSTSTHAAPKSI